MVWVAAFRTPGYRNPDIARTVRSGGDSQPSISSKVRFRVSGFEESKDLTLLLFKLPISEIPIRPGPSDQGRLIAVDLPLEGNFGDFRVSGI